MVDQKEFIETIFDCADDEHVCVSIAHDKRDGSGVWFANHLVTDRVWWRWNPERQPQARYFCVSTVTGERKVLDDGSEGAVLRGRAQLVAAHVLVLDDIGTKGSEPPVEPSYKLESSEGNYQWGYILDPVEDLDRYEAVVVALAARGWGDGGAGGSYRLVRTPGSVNMKPGRGGFISRIVDWHPDRFWSLDELMVAMGLSEDDLKVGSSVRTAVKMSEGGGGVADGVQFNDVLLDHLVGVGDVVSDDGGQWVTVKCPWADEHTSGGDVAGYSPLGRGAGGFVDTRGFKCLHEHCADRNIKSFVQHHARSGGPVVSGFDPLPRLQQQYTYVAMDKMVADMMQHKRGGRWLWDYDAWAKNNPGRMPNPFGSGTVSVASEFLRSGGTTKVDYVKYVAPARMGGEVDLVEVKGQRVVNSFIAPVHDKVDRSPDVFLRHIEFLIPDEGERECFLNWLAYKIQFPASRSYAVIMVAEDGYGTGRSWLKELLIKVLGGHVNTCTIKQLIGLGTSAEQNYNDWMAECLFIVCEEAKESGMKAEDFWNSYETFKTVVDTRVGRDVRINPKFGRIRYEDIYFNALIFSNHSDAIALKEGDRRCFVVENPTLRLDFDYYDELEKALRGDEPSAVYWWLMRRDVSAYDHVYPPMTPAKQKMITITMSPAEEIMKSILADHENDLILHSQIKSIVREHSLRCGLVEIAKSPEKVARRIWTGLKSMAPHQEKGVRLDVDGKKVEVRILRETQLWRVLAVDKKMTPIREGCGLSEPPDSNIVQLK